MDLKSEKAAFLLEFIVVVFLGITAVLTAYASWQSSLYGGNQATKYTMSTSLIAEANSLYNESSQFIAQDMAVWNRINDLRIDIARAESKSDAETVEALQYKLDTIMADNVGEDLATAIEWADAQENYASPFDKEGFVDSYYEEGNAKYAEGQAAMDEGQKANTLGDKLGLVTVIYSVVLFLLGIVGTFKNQKIRLVVTVLSIITLIYGSVLMLSIPVLTI